MFYNLNQFMKESKLIHTVYFFNPTCEYAVANGNVSWQANKLLQKMESDLSNIVQYFALESDVVLVKKEIDPLFLQKLKQINIKIPEFITLAGALNSSEFIDKPKNKLSPWGWSPAAHKLLEPLKKSCSDEFQLSKVAVWKNEYKNLYSKKTAKEVLEMVLSHCSSKHLIAENNIPAICTSKTDFELAIKKWGKIMVKAPWSSSGRGLQPITKTPVHEKVWEKILGIVKDQGYAIAEPFYQKIFDYDLQFRIEKGKVEYVGESIFTTNTKGQYLGNYLNGFPDKMNKKHITFLRETSNVVLPFLITAIENSSIGKFYEGNFGIDMLLVLNENKQLKLHPCLEINVRKSMGLLAISLEKLISNHKKGMFSSYFNPQTLFSDFSTEMQRNHPLQLKNGKIEKGYFPITPSGNKEQFGAYILV